MFFNFEEIPATHPCSSNNDCYACVDSTTIYWQNCKPEAFRNIFCSRNLASNTVISMYTNTMWAYLLLIYNLKIIISSLPAVSFPVFSRSLHPRYDSCSKELQTSARLVKQLTCRVPTQPGRVRFAVSGNAFYCFLQTTFFYLKNSFFFIVIKTRSPLEYFCIFFLHFTGYIGLEKSG